MSLGLIFTLIVIGSFIYKDKKGKWPWDKKSK
ncbi:hypothetical protein Amico_1095 [Aminobacterium colombiense DSM 12261]|uniref:Uncharacterized protein n=1 Tax=Aminobacterium colombiense (strain DSM 12261 / ALA-1) TaxID=572547 RepID=D5EF87_AMICL|nr:hypothetical protein Amico_1095 [Aminobacterium colombiense DSM 12261]